MRTDRSGMTLVEVLLAAMLLGLGMVTIFTSLSRCLRLMRTARDVQKIQLAFDIGDVKYPLNDITSAEDMEKSEVKNEVILEDGEIKYAFSRTFDVKEIEDDTAFNDHLFTERITVSWGDTDVEREEHIRLHFYPKVDEYSK